MLAFYFEYFQTENSLLKVGLHLLQTAILVYISARVWKELRLRNLALDSDSFHDLTILCNVT